MSDETQIKFLDDHEARMAIRFTDGVAMLTFDIGQLRWVQLPPVKLREIASAFNEAANKVEAAA